MAYSFNPRLGPKRRLSDSLSMHTMSQSGCLSTPWAKADSGHDLKAFLAGAEY